MDKDRMDRIQRVRFYEIYNQTDEPIDFLVLNKGEDPREVLKMMGVTGRIHRFTTRNPLLGEKIHYWYNKRK